MLGERLLAEGWAVRGTSRREEGLEPIAAAGIEPALADPDRPGTLLELVGDVAVVHWLLASAQAEREAIAALHGPRLEHTLERLVDTPVRAFVYEASGCVPSHNLEQGETVVRSAAETWRIPIQVVATEPSDSAAWVEEMMAATLELVR